MALSLSTLTDAFTGQPTKDAAAAQRSYYDSQGRLVSGQIAGAQTAGLGTLQSGQAGALNAVGTGTTTGRSDIAGATPQALDYLTNSTGAGTSALLAGQTGGLDALSAGVGKAVGAYSPLSSLGSDYASRAGGAGDITASALGIGGADPTVAQNAFKADPGYQFALEQGLEGITRGANTSGMAAGGNQLRAAGEYATNAANQQYQTFLDNLQKQQNLYAPLAASTTGQAASGVANAELTGGTGGANIYTGTASKLSDLDRATGAQGAGIITGSGQSLADLASKGGTTAGSIFTGTGQSEADLIKGLTGQQVGYTQASNPQYASTYGAEAQAAQGGSANLWNSIISGAKLAAGLPSLPSGVSGGIAALGGTSGNAASPYYQAAYGQPNQLFPNYAA